VTDPVTVFLFFSLWFKKMTAMVIGRNTFNWKNLREIERRHGAYRHGQGGCRGPHYLEKLKKQIIAYSNLIM